MTHIKPHLLSWLVKITYLIALTTTISCTMINTGVSTEKSTTEGSLAQYWLSTSLYAGPFWDNKRFTLVDYRPFFAIDDTKTLDGYTIYPPNPDHIIKAGTLVRVINITFPSPANQFKRPIFSPRNNIWVHLSVAKERGMVNMFKENTHILVVPKSIQTEELLKKYLANFFTQIDPNIQLLQQEKSIRNAIWAKQPLLGMTEKNLTSALGPPTKTETQGRGDLESELVLWHYPDYFIAFEKGIVIKIKSLVIKKDSYPSNNIAN